MGLLLVACGKETVALKDYQTLEGDYQALAADYQALEERVDETDQALVNLQEDLNDQKVSFSQERKDLVKEQGYQDRAYKDYRSLYDQGQRLVEYMMLEANDMTPQAPYVDSRMDEMVYVHYDQDLGVYIYEFKYSFKTESDQEGAWLDFGGQGGHYLLYRKGVCLGNFVMEDIDPSSDYFHDQVKVFLETEALQKLRLDFIDGVEIHSLSGQAKVGYQLDRVSGDFYRVNGAYKGSIQAIYLENPDLYDRLPVHGVIVEEEDFDVDLGPVRLLTLDQGTSHLYIGLVRCSDQEAYIFSYSKGDQSLEAKLDLMTFLRTLEVLPISDYEEISLSQEVVGRGPGIEMVLKEGYFTNDAILWNAMGPKWCGDFEFQVEVDHDLVVTDLKDLWPVSFFHAPLFPIILRDYNKDGLMDFVLSQYGSSNISYYKMFTITESGRVIGTPFEEGNEMIGGPSRATCHDLRLVDDQILMTFYNNMNGNYISKYYRWNGQAYELIKTEKEDY